MTVLRWFLKMVRKHWLLMFRFLHRQIEKAGLSGLKVFLKMQFKKWKDYVTGEVRLCMQQF